MSAAEGTTLVSSAGINYGIAAAITGTRNLCHAARRSRHAQPDRPSPQLSTRAHAVG